MYSGLASRAATWVSSVTMWRCSQSIVVFRPASHVVALVADVTLARTAQVVALVVGATWAVVFHVVALVAGVTLLRTAHVDPLEAPTAAAVFQVVLREAETLVSAPATFQDVERVATTPWAALQVVDLVAVTDVRTFQVVALVAAALIGTRVFQAVARVAVTPRRMFQVVAPPRRQCWRVPKRGGEPDIVCRSKAP